MLVPEIPANDGTSLAMQDEGTQRLFIAVHGSPQNAAAVWRDEHNNVLAQQQFSRPINQFSTEALTTPQTVGTDTDQSAAAKVAAAAINYHPNMDMGMGMGGAGSGAQNLASNYGLPPAAQQYVRGNTRDLPGNPEIQAANAAANKASAAAAQSQPNPYGYDINAKAPDGRSLASEPQPVQDIYWGTYGENYNPAEISKIWLQQNAAAQGGGEPQPQQQQQQQQPNQENAQGTVIPLPFDTPTKDTGPIEGGAGKMFGNAPDLLPLSGWGSSIGGGNPNEMYRWYIEAKTAGYPFFAELWNASPDAAISKYNQWKHQQMNSGVTFIQAGEKGPLMPADKVPGYTKAIERSQQEAASVAPTVETGTDATAITRELVDRGFRPNVAIEEALRGAGMHAGNPFLKDVKTILGRALSPYKFHQQAWQASNPNLPEASMPTFGNFLQGRMAGETGLGQYGTPEVFANLATPPTAKWEAMATALEDPTLGFDVAAAASGLGGPSFLRDALYDQKSQMQNQYQSLLSKGETPDTTGADYFAYLRRQLGAA